MKRSDVGDFSVLYVEPGDQRVDLFQTIGVQKRPVVIILASQAGVLQRPDDFTLLKYVKRQTDLPIIFILPHGSQQAQLAARNGFPVYQSMDALLDALSIGQIARTRTVHSPASSRLPDTANAPYVSRRTKPLFPDEESQGEQQHGQMNIPSTSPLFRSRSSRPLYPSASPAWRDTSSAWRGTRPLPMDDEQSPQKQGSHHPSQQLTPIPESFMPEEDLEQEEIYPDPHGGAQNLHGGAQDPSLQYGTGINIPDRNTAPLAPRKSVGTGLTSPFSPAPQRPYTPLVGAAVFAPAPMQSPASKHIVTNLSSPLPPSIELPDAHMEEEQAQTRQPLHPHSQQKTAEIGLARTPHIPEHTNTMKRLARIGRAHLLLLLALTCVLIIATAGSLLLLPQYLHAGASTLQIDGHLVFTSSGQVSETSSQGIEDQVTLDLTSLAAPASGKALYAWLLGDKSQNDPRTILLGKLTVNNGSAHLFYPGDTQHTNLLLTMSRVLVTEEDATFTPIAPSPDQSTWRHYNEFSTTPINAPDNTKHFSTLDHLRHLLAADPTLEELELPGGLNNWLYNNTNKVKEWLDSTRQQWEETKDTGFVRRQLERSLQFLDGDTFVYQDMPQGTSLLVNERLARIGLINVTGPNQQPPDYLDHISHHLNGLLEAQSTPAMRQKIANLTTALANVNQWLKQVRHDAQQLMQMTDDQMMQQSTLSVIDDMIANMDNAYSGQPDPSTNDMREGVDWIHNQMQFLATLDITHWDGKNPPSTSIYNVPNRNNPNLSQPRVLIAGNKNEERAGIL